MKNEPVSPVDADFGGFSFSEFPISESFASPTSVKLRSHFSPGLAGSSAFVSPKAKSSTPSILQRRKSPSKEADGDGSPMFSPNGSPDKRLMAPSESLFSPSDFLEVTPRHHAPRFGSVPRQLKFDADEADRGPISAGTGTHVLASPTSPFRPPLPMPSVATRRQLKLADEATAAAVTLAELPNSPSPSPSKPSVQMSFGGLGFGLKLTQINQRVNELSSPVSQTRQDELSVSMTRDHEEDHDPSATMNILSQSAQRTRQLVSVAQSLMRPKHPIQSLSATPKKDKSSPAPKENFVNNSAEATVGQ